MGNNKIAVIKSYLRIQMYLLHANALLNDIRNRQHNIWRICLPTHYAHLSELDPPTHFIVNNSPGVLSEYLRCVLCIVLTYDYT